ncbi:unnamed protein product [Fraxinus pennsylvanica]|uniref:Uncharacterized protein n=1 Tax=Fraxinus pennsylvanica TaxID=56036 RepID=A0AAD2DTC9_9LAMI|nr:unnamed protein product [Fraxinus pennsylvanica]
MHNAENHERANIPFIQRSPKVVYQGEHDKLTVKKCIFSAEHAVYEDENSKNSSHLEEEPDVIGPGVNILAAWTEAVGPTGLEQDTRKTKFNIMSGTSMSCPHISGLVALLKAAHPDWSPSAIKSALMTTAYTLDNTSSPLRDAADNSFANPWAHGSGHVDPHKALSPGLVYDITLEDQLNYPSFSVLSGKSRAARYSRELTNVGAARSIYQVMVEAPQNVVVTVKPPRLVFGNVGDKQRYTVTFVSKKGVNLSGRNAFGSISWKNTKHLVKSSVAFSWTHI